MGRSELFWGLAWLNRSGEEEAVFVHFLCLPERKRTKGKASGYLPALGGYPALLKAGYGNFRNQKETIFGFYPEKEVAIAYIYRYGVFLGVRSVELGIERKFIEGAGREYP